MKKTPVVALLSMLLMLLASVAVAQEATSLKVYISVDMEGIGGVVTHPDQTSPDGFEYAQARKWMTAEANAAIEAAFEAGATEVLVSDSHGNGESLLPDDLDPRVELIRAWPRKLGMMGGIDETFDAVIFIGYHASDGQRHATLAHTMSGGRIYNLKLNGVTVPEAGFNAAIAGHFGVPVILVSGDQTIVEETRALVGDIEGAVVKHGIGTVARMMHPTRTQELIRQKTRAALARLQDFKPWQLNTPVTIEIAFTRESYAEVAGYFPNVEMVDGRTVRYTGKNMVEISGFFMGLLGL